MNQPYRDVEALAEPPAERMSAPATQGGVQAAAVITAVARRRVRAAVPAHRAVAIIRVARHQAAVA